MVVLHLLLPRLRHLECNVLGQMTQNSVHELLMLGVHELLEINSRRMNFEEF